LVPIVNPEKEGTYWTELVRAADLHVTNPVRKKHAASALYAESNYINGMFNAFNSDLDNLDRAVSQLIEKANAIRNREYREGAVIVSQRAREVHSGYASLRALYSLGFSTRRGYLEKIVAEDGSIQPVEVLNNYNAISPLVAEQEDVEKQLSLSMDRLKDAFSALKGAAGFKAYPSKWDGDKR
jgi:hypothetical protein